jgi:ubiquinone/menaquinone biosynthesis C-methylase UbiE
MSKFNNSTNILISEKLKKRKSNIKDEVSSIINIQLQKRYDRIASQWNGKAYEGTRRDDLIPRIIEISEIEDGQKILEVMCGTALLSKRLKVLFPRCQNYVLDFSQGMLNMSPKELKKIQASVVDIPFPNESFDRIFLRSAIYDLPKTLQIKALKEINRVLVSNGTFILQTYITTDITHNALNDIVNIKDLASGQYQSIDTEKYPRYFAKLKELKQWFYEAGFCFEEIDNFEGTITYMRTKEMTDLGKSMWVEYTDSLSNEIKESLRLKIERDGTVTYNFPGMIFKLRKRVYTRDSY